MALRVKATTDSGIVMDESYARIRMTTGDKTNQSIVVDYYVSQASFAEGKSPAKSEDHTHSISVEENAPNFIKQGYEYLKTLPEFADAIDC